MSAIGRARSLRRPVRLGLRLPRLGRRVWLGLVIAVALLGGGYMWLRDSSLVAVRQVRITGNDGPDQAKIARALRLAALGMTTMDVRIDGLRTAVAPFPVVKDLQVSTQFPHGIRIRVIEQIPVAAVSTGGRAIAVAGDGTLLANVPASGLPSVPMTVPPGGARLTDPAALEAVRVLAAAPYPLLARVGSVTTVSGKGLVAQLRNGPSIVFGDTGSLPAKWSAATAVLADSGSAGAEYIDVSDPARPAAGANPQSAGLAANAGAAASSAAGVAASSASGAAAAGTTVTGG